MRGPSPYIEQETGSQFLLSVGDGEKTQPGAWQWCHLLSSTKTKTFLRINVCLHPGSAKMTVLSKGEG